MTQVTNLFADFTDFWKTDHVKSRGLGVICYIFHVALNFHNVVVTHAKLRCDTNTLKKAMMAHDSRVLLFLYTGPRITKGIRRSR